MKFPVSGRQTAIFSRYKHAEPEITVTPHRETGLCFSFPER